MSFAENLQRIRKEKHLSQEQLAEMLDVSRQAVSKWELEMGYPEVEKLLLLSRELNVSLDSLMAGEGTPGTAAAAANPEQIPGKITISSPHEHIVLTCSKVMSSQRFKGSKKSPQYALFAAKDDSASFWANTFLAWYANEEDLEREMAAIQDAMFQGKPTYELQFSVQVEKTLFGLRVSDN